MNQSHGTNFAYFLVAPQITRMTNARISTPMVAATPTQNAGIYTLHLPNFVAHVRHELVLHAVFLGPSGWGFHVFDDLPVFIPGPGDF